MKTFQMKGNEGLSPEIKEKINIRLVKYCFFHIRTSLLISLFCATILFLGLYPSHDIRYLIAWYGLTISVTFLRWILGKLYDDQEAKIQNFTYWRNLFTLGALWGGVCWSYLVVYIFPYVSNLQQTLCILIIAGVTAGSVTTLSGVKFAVVGYLCFSLIPLILELFLINNYIYQLFTFTAVVYFLFLVIISSNIHNIIRNVIYLQFENDGLLKKLQHHATHDILTDMDNSRQFYSNLSYAIEHSQFNNQSFTLLFIDLDHFKEVNDNFGHDMGDKLLMEVSSRLKKIIRNADFVARIGGDEFTIILWQLKDKENIAKIAKKINHNLSEPFEIDSETFHISASIGISIYPNDGFESLTLIRAADKAMYYVKKHGKNSFCFANKTTEAITME